MSAVEEVSHQDGANQVSDVVVRFAGDSGDGMQLTGRNFTEATAIYGNDLATFPDFPAEIRAPAGATFGVSAFQIYFGSEDVSTAGDDVDVLVAMNPAALITNLKDVLVGGLLIIDSDAFTDKNLARAGYSSNPIEDGSLDAYRVIPIAVTKQVLESVKPFGLSHKFAVRCKNMWTLGLVMWLFDRDRSITTDSLKQKFANKPEIADANIAALNAGHAYAETAELPTGVEVYRVPRAGAAPGLYRNITGSESLAYGLIGATAGFFGAGINLQAIMQTPWVLIVFSLIFIFLAFSMFGFYDIKLPSKFQNKITDLSNKQIGGNFIGVSIMRFLSALIV